MAKSGMVRAENALVRRTKGDTATMVSAAIATPIASLLQDGVQDGALLCGFQADSPAGQAAIFAAESGDSMTADEIGNDEIMVISWLAKRIQMADQLTGQPVPNVRVVLFTASGDSVSFVSLGVVLSLDLIRSFAGDGPYDPPIGVRVVTTRTRQGRRLLRLVPSGLMTVARQQQ